MRLLLVFVFVFFYTFPTSILVGGLQCDSSSFPCSNGRQCILKSQWCDDHDHCNDKSDEFYCNSHNSYYHCPSGWFRCSSDRCIPMEGRCDGLDSCEDGSDESGCPIYFTTYFTTPKVNETEVMLLQNATVKAVNWIMSLEDDDHGWEEDTQRAVITLHLAEPGLFHDKNNDRTSLFAKELQLRLALDLLKNDSSSMPLFKLSLYINALLATCKDPSNYYGIDLTQELRRRTNQEQISSGFISPFVYLTLCISGKSNNSDLLKIREIFTSSDPKLGKLDLQSLAYLAISCIERFSHFSNSTASRDEALNVLSRKAEKFGNIYTAALVFQAMTLANKTEKDWQRNAALDFILRKQDESGSFGDILATYYVMPAITGRPFESLRDSCNETRKNGLKPLNLLENSGNSKVVIVYSLYVGNDINIKHTIQMKIPESTSFFDVMRMAEKENPKFKFRYETLSRSYPTVFSIGDIPNDAEKSMFWSLFTISAKGLKMEEKVELEPYAGDVRNLKLKNGDQAVFWFKKI